MSPSKRTLRLAAATFFLLALAWEHIQATRLGYRAEKARREVEELRGRLGVLQVRLETLVSPGQLEAVARGRLGMVPGSPESLVILGSNGTEGRPGEDRLMARLKRSLAIQLLGASLPRPRAA